MADVGDVIILMARMPDKISQVEARGNEIFFRYGDYAFSVLTRSGGDDVRYGRHTFYVYPKWADSVHKLADAFEAADPEDQPAMVSYNETDLPVGVRDPLRSCRENS